MTIRRYRLITILLLTLLVGGSISVGKLAARPAGQDGEPLRVVTKPFPPFVIIQNGGFTGFSMELWDAIAQELDEPYELYEVETVSDQLAAVQNGQADVAIAGITITEQREEVVDFTYPYFDSGLQIMIHGDADSSTILNSLRAILSPSFLQFMLIFLVLIVITAHIYWLFERRHPEFPRSYREGISQLLWWSALTVFNHDDKPPATRFGYIIAFMWMFAGVFLIANLTATLSAGATVRELRSAIQDVSDLRGQRVVTVAGTTSSRFLDANGVAYTGVATIDEAYDLLQRQQTDAVVYDAPVLRYYISTNPGENLELVGQVVEIEKYGIALPSGSPYREAINRATLKLVEDGTYQQLYQRWFGASNG